MKVLVVENQLRLTEILAGRLGDCCDTIVSAQTGATAKRAIWGSAIDHILIDFELPNDEGLDLLIHCQKLGFANPAAILSMSEEADIPEKRPLCKRRTRFQVRYKQRQ